MSEKGTIVEFVANGSSSQGYLSEPEGGGPGVIVIQEWWGLVGHIKNVADRFAAAGYVALAPDLYHGKETTSPDDAGKLMMALNIDRAEKDLRGACDYLGSRSSGGRLGIIGFCMGGQLALYAASKNENIGACIDFYGIHPNVKPVLEAIKAPVLGLFAALLHGPEQIADLPVPVVESPGAVRIGHPERGHLVEYLAPNSVFNSLPRQRSCPHLGPDDRFVTIDRVLHHASLGAA